MNQEEYETPRSAFCSHCQKECTCVKYDDSFDYAGTHCTHGIGGTQHEYHWASDCCDAECDDGRFVMCQCGNEIEISPEAELHKIKCDACKRTGKWLTEY